MGEIAPVLVAPARLQLMTLAAAATRIEFATLRESLEVSDSVLSKHLSALADAGLVTTTKGVERGRRTTWVAVTKSGRQVLSEHVAALRRIIDGVE